MIPHAYPYHNATVELEAPPWAASGPKSKRCATPGCVKRRGHGLFATMCKRHADRLAAIREELRAETSIGGRYAQRRDQRKASILLGSTCCEPGCEEPRDHPAALCEAHLMAEAA
jgi:hypothetical protein